MASRLLRNIAVSIGAGLASGLHRRRPATRPAPTSYPLLDRIEEIESRVTRVELAPVSIVSPAPEEIEALGTLVSSQAEDIATLRQEIGLIERRSAEQVEAFGQKIALLEHQVPVQIEAAIAARMTELEQKLRGEFREIHYQTVDAFAETIEKRIVNRINLLENNLIEQSHSIKELREKSLRTDDNLQRLLEAVEKLCARAEARSQISLIERDGNIEPPSKPLHEPDQQAEPVVAAAPVTRIVESEPEPEPADLHVRRFDRERDPEDEYESVASVASRNGHSTHSRRQTGLKPVGVALLGLALIGLRLMK